MSNLVYYGDNAEGLRHLQERQESVDLVYIDPPFGTSNEFLIDEGRANSISASGLPAYSDKTSGNAYLEALEARLWGIHAVMAEFASIYVHIGVNMEHHVRLIMDKVFGPQNFRNSITRIKCNPKNFERNSYGNIKDTVLFYSRSPAAIAWNPQPVPMSSEQLARLYPKVDARGRRFTTTPLHAPGQTVNGPTGQPWRGLAVPAGRHWRYSPNKLDELDQAGLIHWSKNGNPRKIRYADDGAGTLPQDVWWYKDPQNPDYPTQKNAQLLERIIKTSSNPGDTVLDCYAGSGTTLLQSARLGRRFIGMDDSAAAQQVIERRLRKANVAYSIIRDKGDLAGTQTPEPLAFEANERGINLRSLAEVAYESANRE